MSKFKSSIALSYTSNITSHFIITLVSLVRPSINSIYSSLSSSIKHKTAYNIPTPHSSFHSSFHSFTCFLPFWYNISLSHIYTSLFIFIFLSNTPHEAQAKAPLLRRQAALTQLRCLMKLKLKLRFYADKLLLRSYAASWSSYKLLRRQAALRAS